MTKLLPLGFLLVATSATARADTPKSATELFDALAALPGLSADYREDKFISVLTEPVSSEGTILFAPPAVLIRVTKSPIWSSVLFEEESIVYRDAAGPQKLPAAKGDPARAFVEVFVDVARGNRKSLEKAFQITFEGTKAGWVLTLTPNKKNLGLRRIELAGSGLEISTMKIEDQNGDRTELTFSNIDSSRAPTRKEIEKASRAP